MHNKVSPSYIIDLIEKESNISDSDFSEEAAEYFKHIKWE